MCAFSRPARPASAASLEVLLRHDCQTPARGRLRAGFGLSCRGRRCGRPDRPVIEPADHASRNLERRRAGNQWRRLDDEWSVAIIGHADHDERRLLGRRACNLHFRRGRLQHTFAAAAAAKLRGAGSINKGPSWHGRMSHWTVRRARRCVPPAGDVVLPESIRRSRRGAMDDHRHQRREEHLRGQLRCARAVLP